MLGWDWLHSFYPAVAAFLSGRDPYAVGPFFNPPWLLPFLVPFYWLGLTGGDIALKLFTFAGLAALCYRLKTRRWLTLFLVAISFPFVALLIETNVDGIVLWGLALQGPVGLLLLSVKPQVAGIAGGIWLWQAWTKDGWSGVVRLIWLTAGAATIGTLLYPQWLFAMNGATHLPAAQALNLWPYLIPLGLAALVLSFERPAWAGLATNLLAPYLGVVSYVGGLATLIEYTGPLAVLSVCSWLLLIPRLK